MGGIYAAEEEGVEEQHVERHVGATQIRSRAAVLEGDDCAARALCEDKRRCRCQSGAQHALKSLSNGMTAHDRPRQHTLPSVPSRPRRPDYEDEEPYRVLELTTAEFEEDEESDRQVVKLNNPELKREKEWKYGYVWELQEQPTLYKVVAPFSVKYRESADYDDVYDDGEPGAARGLASLSPRGCV